MKLTRTQARERVFKRRQGRGWIVCVLDAKRGIWTETAQMPYAAACTSVRDWITRLTQPTEVRS